MIYTQTEIGSIPQGVVANVAGTLGTTTGNLFNGVRQSLHGASRATYGGLRGTLTDLPVRDELATMVEDIIGGASFILRGIGHLAVDILPYCIGGNNRAGAGVSCF